MFVFLILTPCPSQPPTKNIFFWHQLRVQGGYIILSVLVQFLFSKTLTQLLVYTPSSVFSSSTYLTQFHSLQSWAVLYIITSQSVFNFLVYFICWYSGTKNVLHGTATSAAWSNSHPHFFTDFTYRRYKLSELVTIRWLTFHSCLRSRKFFIVYVDVNFEQTEQAVTERRHLFERPKRCNGAGQAAHYYVLHF
jgi:hypothetical protein